MKAAPVFTEEQIRAWQEKNARPALPTVNVVTDGSVGQRTYVVVGSDGERQIINPPSGKSGSSEPFINAGKKATKRPRLTKQQLQERAERAIPIIMRLKREHPKRIVPNVQIVSDALAKEGITDLNSQPLDEGTTTKICDYFHAYAQDPSAFEKAPGAKNKPAEARYAKL